MNDLPQRSPRSLVGLARAGAMVRRHALLASLLLIGVVIVSAVLVWRAVFSLERVGPLRLAVRVDGPTLILHWDADLAPESQLTIVVWDWDAYQSASADVAFDIDTFPYRVERAVSLVAGGGTESIDLTGWPPGELLVSLEGPDTSGPTGAQLSISDDGTRYLWTATEVRLGP